MTWRRRDVLRVLGAGAAAACSGGSPPPCVSPSDAGGRTYCLVDGERVRVPLAATLGIGQSVLYNVDDNTAVIVVRDGMGLYALSGICTHQCCLVALCEDTACGSLGTNPGTCAATATATPSVNATAILCACHGSTFAIDGTVLKGPATRALPHYDVSVDGADAVVDTSRIVPAATRVSP